jgi:hypothetical protein
MKILAIEQNCLEEGHLLIENFVDILFVTSLSVSLHNLLDFYNLFCLCCIVLWLVDSLRLIYIYTKKPFLPVSQHFGLSDHRLEDFNRMKILAIEQNCL